MNTQASSSSSSALQAQNNGLRIIEHGQRKYAPRIPAQTWEKIKPVLQALNDAGLTRAEMRASLIEHHGLSPSINQLNDKMTEWGFTPISRLPKMSTLASSLGAEQMHDKDLAGAMSRMHLAVSVPHEQSKNELVHKASGTNKDDLNAGTVESAKKVWKTHSEVSNVSSKAGRGKESALSQSSSTDDGRVDGLADDVDPNGVEELMERNPNHREGGNEYNGFNFQTLGSTSESQPIISTDMANALIVSVAKDPGLSKAEASDAMDDIALFLSMLHCSSAASHIFSNNIRLWREQNQNPADLPLRAAIDCSRTASTNKDLAFAHDALQAATRRLAAPVKLCPCVYRKFMKVLDANGWNEDDLGLIDEDQFTEFHEARPSATVRSNVRQCILTPHDGWKSVTSNTISKESWSLDDYILLQIAPWAIFELGDVAVLEALQLCDAQPLNTCHEILLTCHLTRKWIEAFQTNTSLLSASFRLLGFGIAVAVQAFAVVANHAIRSVGRQLGRVFTKDLTPEALRECSEAALGPEPLQRAEELADIHIGLLVPDLDARQWIPKHMSPNQVSDIATYVYSTVSLVAELAVRQRKRDAVSRTKTKTESISHFSMSSASIRSGESVSMRSFRNASKRAQWLVSRLRHDENDLTCTPRSSISHMSWNFNELTGFPDVPEEGMTEEPGDFMMVG